MSVDIKQLRIGSHVEVNGVRARVIELVEKHLQNQPWAMYAATIDGENRTCGGFLQDAESIPITPELLVELGFEKENNLHPSYEGYHKGDLSISRLYSSKNWQLEIDSDVHYSIYHNTHVRYLHEVENFIYLTLGKELIEE